ncbi:ATP-binding protein [Streptomyces sp. NC-S4]
MIEYLQGQARRNSGRQPTQWQSWEQLRQAARSERRISGRPWQLSESGPALQPLPGPAPYSVPTAGTTEQGPDTAATGTSAARRSNGPRQSGRETEPDPGPVGFASRDFFRDLIENRTRLFTGRQTESTRITDYIRTRGSGYVFVEALSGYGKTSLLADLVSRHPDFRYHFISQAHSGRGEGLFDPANADHVLECLCEQLDPAHVPGMDPESVQRQFRALLRHEPKRPTVIVLDAIDELTKPERLLHVFPQQLPQGLVVLLSGRTRGDKRSCLSDIGLSPSATGLHLSLRGLDEAALIDLLRMAGGEATELAEDTDFVGEVHQLSAGDPFYLRFLVEDAAAGTLTRDTVDRTPSGLEGYLDQQFEQLTRSAHRLEHAQILALLYQARTLSAVDLTECVPGLTLNNLNTAEVLHGQPRVNFDTVVREIHRFLLVHRRPVPDGAPARSGEMYSFCHDRFRQYFRVRAGIG